MTGPICILLYIYVCIHALFFVVGMHNQVNFTSNREMMRNSQNWRGDFVLVRLNSLPKVLNLLRHRMTGWCVWCLAACAWCGVVCYTPKGASLPLGLCSYAFHEEGSQHNLLCSFVVTKPLDGAATHFSEQPLGVALAPCPLPPHSHNTSLSSSFVFPTHEYLHPTK